MAMTTRCPQCAAAFHVVPDQLRVRSGLVRCGACGSVFDGYACLVSDEEAAEPLRRNPPAVFRNRADMLRAQPADRLAGQEHADGPDDDLAGRADDAGLRRLHGEPAGWHPDPGPGSAARDAPPGGQTPHAAPVPDAGEPPGAGRAPVLRAQRPDDEADDFRPWYGGDDVGSKEPSAAPGRIMGEQRYESDPPVPEFMDEDLQRRRRLYRKLWMAAAIAALVVLALQLLTVYRMAIAAALPLSRPALSLLCQPLGCSVGYERRAERISIMSSSLQPDGERAPANATASGDIGDQATGRLVLNVVLRNRYDRPQQWPALMLDLRDLSDTVVVRKALMPQDYLPPGVAGQPFGAGAEISLSVPLAVDTANVNGYQIDKFFP